jgi:hypothetical protein
MSEDNSSARLGYTSNWSRQDRAICDDFFRSIQKKKDSDRRQLDARANLARLLNNTLQEISLGNIGL